MEKSLQKLTLTDRRKLEVGGVLEIISYDEVRSGHTYSEYTEAKNSYKAYQKMNFSQVQEIDLNLEVGAAFSENGTVEITGYIRTIHFCDGKSGYADNFISRIFR